MSSASMLTVAAATGGCWLLGGLPRGPARRLAALRNSSPLSIPDSKRASGAPAACAAGGLCGLAVASLIGALGGIAVGSIVAFAVLRWWSRSATARGPSAVGRRSWTAGHPQSPLESVSRQLPAALDLIAACLAAGATADRALLAVGAAFGAGIGDVLSNVARLSALGAPVETAWSWCLDDARWAPVARAVIRAHHSGAALGDALSHLAEDRRRVLRSDAQVAAQRAGVRAVLPLGLCFLPAFVLVGVVPVVAGFAHTLWS